MTIDQLAIISDHTAFRAALATLVVFCFGIYQRLNDPDPKAMVLMTRFDDRIPFVPAFSVPYLLYLPYLLFVAVYGIVASPYYPQIAASMLAVQLIAAVIYSAKQSYVPRPNLVIDGVFSRLTAFIYRHDRPYCAFPSLHVAYSLLCAYWSTLLFPSLAPLFIVLTASIIASTLFIKQHALADVAAGASLTALCLLLIH